MFSVAINILLSVVLILFFIASTTHHDAASTLVKSPTSMLMHEPFSRPRVNCDSSDPDTCDCDGEPVGAHTLPNIPLQIKSLFEASALMGGVSTPLVKYKAKATIVV